MRARHPRFLQTKPKFLAGLSKEEMILAGVICLLCSLLKVNGVKSLLLVLTGLGVARFLGALLPRGFFIHLKEGRSFANWKDLPRGNLE